MAFGTKIGFEPIRTVAFGSITGTYAALGSALTGHVRILTITNSTNQDVLISFDGTNDHLRLFSGSFKLFDLTTNRVQEDGLFFAVGTQIYVKSAVAPANGNVWVECANAVAGGV